MATLALPNLPLYLYRYRSVSPRENDTGQIQPTINREIEALKKPYIYCADFHRLNDPMEGFYRPSRLHRSRVTMTGLLRGYSTAKFRSALRVSATPKRTN
jgi:hypothetical protein